MASTITNGSRSLVNSLYSFPKAAVTNYHRLKGLKQHKFYYLTEVPNGSCWGKKQGVGVPSGGFKEESTSSSFPASKGCLHSFACSPLPPSSKSGV